MRKTLIVANWKMNKPVQYVQEYLALLNKSCKIKSRTDLDIALAPAFPYMAEVQNRLQGTGVALCAQNASHQDRGAFTGEVSATMLMEFGVSMVILGHSERRQYFKETDEYISSKVNLCLAHNLSVILCVGETLEERNKNETFSVLDRQIRDGLKDVTNISKVVIAYEPVWAIGTGVSATPEQAQEAHLHIRDWIGHKFGNQKSGSLRILYGGSMTAANAKTLLSQPDIDGGLVGGASLDANTFAELINASSIKTNLQKGAS